MRVLDNTGLVGAWGSADTLSMAASCGSLIAAAHGTSVTLVNVDATSGEPNASKTLQFSQQVSAVAFLKMPHAVAAVSGLQLSRQCSLATSHVICKYQNKRLLAFRRNATRKFTTGWKVV